MFNQSLMNKVYAQWMDGYFVKHINYGYSKATMCIKGSNKAEQIPFKNIFNNIKELTNNSTNVFLYTKSTFQHTIIY